MIFISFSAPGTIYVGDLEDIFKIAFHLLFQGPNYVPDKCVFDLSVLVSFTRLNSVVQINLNFFIAVTSFIE